MTLRELHLFAGVGGGILAGVLLGHECVCAVELDPYCQKVLRARQADGLLPAFPIESDVRAFDGKPWRGQVDVVCGGFPCQPWSMAGKRLGKEDPRHLWPEMARIVDEVRPAFVFAENVSLAAFEEPWRDLRRMGYRVPPALRLGGCQMGAMFHRHRWWLLAADADGDGRALLESKRVAWVDSPTAHRQDAAHSAFRTWRTTGFARLDEGVADAAEPYHGRQRDIAVNEEVACASSPGDADGSRLAQRECERSDACAQQPPALGATWRAAAPRLRRLVSGHARGMDSRRKRIHALGNAQVPIVAATAFVELMSRIA